VVLRDSVSTQRLREVELPNGRKRHIHGEKEHAEVVGMTARKTQWTINPRCVRRILFARLDGILRNPRPHGASRDLPGISNETGGPDVSARPVRGAPDGLAHTSPPVRRGAEADAGRGVACGGSAGGVIVRE